MKWGVQPFIVVPCPSSSASLSFLFLLFFPSSWWEWTVFVAGDKTLARFLYALSPTTTASASPTCCHLPNTAESGDNQTLFILSVSDLGFWAKRESVGGGGVRAQQIPNPNRHRYHLHNHRWHPTLYFRLSRGWYYIEERTMYASCMYYIVESIMYKYNTGLLSNDECPETRVQYSGNRLKGDQNM